MSFRLVVTNASAIPSVEGYLLDVVVESGNFSSGDVAIVESTPERQITIRSIALVGGRDPVSDVVTIAIEKPTFPIGELLGRWLRSTAEDDPG